MLFHATSSLMIFIIPLLIFAILINLIIGRLQTCASRTFSYSSGIGVLTEYTWISRTIWYILCYLLDFTCNVYPCILFALLIVYIKWLIFRCYCHYCKRKYWKIYILRQTYIEYNRMYSVYKTAIRLRDVTFMRNLNFLTPLFLFNKSLVVISTISLCWRVSKLSSIKYICSNLFFRLCLLTL